MNANIMDSERIMNAELTVSEAVNNINFKDIESMMNGCNSAVVIMGIKHFSSKLKKMVFAYNKEDTCMDDVVACAMKLARYSDFAIARAFIYSVTSPQSIKHLDHIIFKTKIFQEQPGFKGV